MLKKLSIISLAVLLSSLSACTTISKEQRTLYDAQQKSVQAKPVNVLTNSCFIRIEIGDNDIYYQKAIDSGETLMSALLSQLAENDVQVKNKQMPLVCGQLGADQLKKMALMKTNKGKEQDITVTPLTTEGNNFNAKENKAFQKIFDRLAEGQFAKNVEPLNLEKDTIKHIKKAIGSEKLVVLMAHETEVSFGAQMTVGAATAILSGGSYITSLQEGLWYKLYVINLDDNTIEWHKSKADHRTDDMLYPLFEKKS